MDKIGMTDRTPLVCVIVPVFNAERTLDKCIQSLIGQEFRNLEILLVDDGSTDRSLQICRGYASRDARIKVFSQENAGPAAARNLALDEAKGDYISFCDSDDYMTTALIGNEAL